MRVSRRYISIDIASRSALRPVAGDRLRRVIPRDSEILERLRQKGSRVLSFRELAKALHVGDAEEDAFRERLDALERQGEIARVRGEKYSAIEFSNLVAGRITVRPEGFGFVLVPDGEDLFVPRSGMHGAMDGDTVLAREERTPRRAAAMPDEDLGHGRQGARPRPRAGRRPLRDRGRHRSSSCRTTRRSTPSSASRTARRREPAKGEIVEARLTAFPDARRVAHGVVEERLGFLGEPGVDIEIVLRSHNLPPRFPEPVVAESEAFPEEVLPRRPARAGATSATGGSSRSTARRRRTSTTRSRSSGRPDGYRLGVHIADVSHYVAEGTALDDEARSRGTSRLLPGPRPADAAGAALERPLLAQPARRPPRPVGDPRARRDGPRRRVRSSPRA